MNSNSSLQGAYKIHGERMHDNVRERLLRQSIMDTDAEFRAAEVKLSLLDPLYFFRWHAWTHDPRPHIQHAYGFTLPTLPFYLFPFQEDFVMTLVDHIRRGEDVLIEKTRDMGISWLVITVFLWFWLQPAAGNDFLIGSRKSEFVDKKGAIDTLLEKFRFNLYMLHGSFRPSGFDRDKHDVTGYITNPATGSFVRGEANNANFATSGRYRAILADEFSKWEETDESAWTSMGDSSPCRVPVSTPWGIGRKFAQLRNSGAIKVLTLHWSQHPIKGAGQWRGQHPLIPAKVDVPLSEWYLGECERRADDPRAGIGQELDIDYLTSGTPFFDNLLVQRRIDALTEAPPAIERMAFEIVDDGHVNLFASPHGRIYVASYPVKDDDVKDLRYVIGADVAEGIEGGDYSVAVVYDRVIGQDAAWFHGLIDTDVFAVLLSTLGWWYQTAWIAVENNNHGHAVLQKLKGIYTRLLFEGQYTDFADAMSTRRLGWSTTTVTRPIMTANLRMCMRQGTDGILDKDALRECLTFAYDKNGKPTAQEGCNDDRVMAQAIKLMAHQWIPAPVRVHASGWTDTGQTDHGKMTRKGATKRGEGAKFV